jgi:predicted transcriptional regulator
MADTQASTGSADNLTELAADIVGAYVANNSVQVADLPNLIGQVHSALQQMASGKPEAQAAPQEPAVPIRRSVQPDAITCLEDGKKFKSLKRHLRTDHNMTPQEYRAKWGLKPDYPMVAPNYAASRSELAKKMGLGQKRVEARAAQQPQRRGGRGRKAAAE